jgi:ribosome biogenesis protein ENP2
MNVGAVNADVKVYTVNGAAAGAGSASSLPDWLTRKRAVKSGRSKRTIREEFEGAVNLIQHFEFPEASNRIKCTRDGHHAVATGVYKPQMRVYDLDQLTLKFERHSDAENVDFIVGSLAFQVPKVQRNDLLTTRYFRTIGRKLFICK